MSNNDKEEKPKNTKKIYSVFHTIVAFFAIYLSFKCGKGFNLPHFLAACCCPMCYIVYAFAVKKGCKDSSSSDSNDSTDTQ